MTSRTGTDGHPEVAEISALTEGVLSPARTTDIREHLADCALCEDVRSSLDEIRGLLGTLPGPTRMPVDVAERIDAALAAEALLSATAPEADVVISQGGGVSRETGTEEPSTESPALADAAVSRETDGAPDAAPVHGTARLDTTKRDVADRPAGRPHATTGPKRRDPASGPRTRRARRWPRALLGTACAAAVIGVGSFLLQSGGGGDTHADGPRTDRVSPSDRSTGDLTARVQALLKSAKGPEVQGMTPRTAPEKTLSDSGVTAPACVREGIGRPEPALATRQDIFDGEDAYLIVLPHPGDTTLVDAYLVSAACGSATSPAPGKVLINQTLPRG
ncbi:hypothetical protein [Streptomyces hesseae]|uniref:Zinc-finger domain-containing protein n=1 Tax=Streptomyces hesseae TaxID=3075519 RepID=A0ABU2SYP1_9ACTN|nr:hypothetical protein [Streptomyces sp. DSM 40473]MDT0453044.1 hypothetical protein [Streptomyces sp. DSM 40473]